MSQSDWKQNLKVSRRCERFYFPADLIRGHIFTTSPKNYQIPGSPE